MGQRRSRRQRRRQRPKAVPEASRWETTRDCFRMMIGEGWGAVFTVSLIAAFGLLLVSLPPKGQVDNPSAALLPAARGWLVVPGFAMTASGVAFALRGREGWLGATIVLCLGLTAVAVGLDYWAPDSGALLLLLPGSALCVGGALWLTFARGARGLEHRFTACAGAVMFGVCSLAFAIGWF